MKVLAIGNSFSQDATRYLHGIAKSGGVDMKVVNLYIGGCPLSVHYANALENNRAYSMEFNGEPTGFYVSIKEALLSEMWSGWDVVTIQQVSSLSSDYATFQPYLDFMRDYIKKYSPKSKLYLHQTWGYTQEHSKECGFKDHADMFAHVKKAYEQAAKAIKADGIIPSGEVMNALMASSAANIHRDSIHASLGLGCYALGLNWYRTLTGNSAEDNGFNDFDEHITETEIALAKKAVEKIKKG